MCLCLFPCCCGAFLFPIERKASTSNRNRAGEVKVNERENMWFLLDAVCTCVCESVCFLFEGGIGRGLFLGGGGATDKTERENRKREIGEGSLQLWQLLCDLWGVACGSVSDPKTEGWWMASSIPLSLLKALSLCFFSVLTDSWPAQSCLYLYNVS